MANYGPGFKSELVPQILNHYLSFSACVRVTVVVVYVYLSVYYRASGYIPGLFFSTFTSLLAQSQLLPYQASYWVCVGCITRAGHVWTIPITYRVYQLLIIAPCFSLA